MWASALASLNVSLGYGAADIRIDMGAALSLAVAEGCAAEVAAPLLRSVAAGLSAAQRAQRERKDG